MLLSNVAAPEWKYPELKMSDLREIVKNAVEGRYGAKPCVGVIKVGLVGSMARGGNTRVSDVDLLLDSTDFMEDLSILGEYVGHKLDSEYNKRLDIIDYRFASDVISGKKAVDDVWKYRIGYKRMLNEVIWLYG